MRIITVILLIIAGVFCTTNTFSYDFSLSSPDGRIKGNISVDNQVSYSISYRGKPCLLPSPINCRLSDGRVLGEQLTVINSHVTVTDRIILPLYGISTTLRAHYTELSLEFSGNYKLLFRAYNEGFAYRFVTTFKDSITVESEKSEFRFAGNYDGYFHPELSEADYRMQKISEVKLPNYSSLPLMVRADGGLNMLIHESDVTDYPCMSLSTTGKDNTLAAAHARYPKKVTPGGHMNFNLLVKERENYIAKTSGSRNFPWRLIAFEEQDGAILANQLVYLLAAETKLKALDWIKPGKVAWDWWNALNLSGVNFETGFNTRTYKYFIDFAANNGLEYVNLDEGWSAQFDLMKITDQLDMPEIIRYAKEKKVRLILWCVWYVLDRQMQEALDQFERWGIAGIKVDFMDRDDQKVVVFQETLLKEAAKRKLLVNYHGAYHPTGMERSYPNWINTEGVKGSEWNKFDPAGASPETDVTIPFIRMFAGAMDYTPGAMQNYNKTDWKQIFERPMSQGTRCHQLAMYTVYYAPLQMLCDAPSAYEKEPVYLKYLTGIPTVWDEVFPLDSKVSEYVCVARKKGSKWFMAAMTNWTKRTLKVKLDFLSPGKRYEAEIFMDGPNAGKVGSDYKRTVMQVKRGDEISIDMASGGGWSAQFTLLNTRKQVNSLPDN